MLLLKVVYPYEYMSEWELTIDERENFYSNLDMEDITVADYMYAKRVCKDFEMKNLGEFHDFYLKSNTLLLLDVFENFRKIFLKNYHLDLPKFLSTPGLLWHQP